MPLSFGFISRETDTKKLSRSMCTMVRLEPAEIFGCNTVIPYDYNIVITEQQNKAERKRRTLRLRKKIKEAENQEEDKQQSFEKDYKILPEKIFIFLFGE